MVSQPGVPFRLHPKRSFASLLWRIPVSCYPKYGRHHSLYCLESETAQKGENEISTSMYFSLLHQEHMASFLVLSSPATVGCALNLWIQISPSFLRSGHSHQNSSTYNSSALCLNFLVKSVFSALGISISRGHCSLNSHFVVFSVLCGYMYHRGQRSDHRSQNRAKNPWSRSCKRLTASDLKCWEPNFIMVIFAFSKKQFSPFLWLWP